MMDISNSYVCPNNHITEDPRRCECGETNLLNLGRVLGVVPTPAEEISEQSI